MKRLRFRYEMHLKLDQAVWDHHFLIRCRPMESARQQREHLSVEIEPADFIWEVKDGFGNEGYAGSAKKPHNSLLTVSEGVVRVDITKTSEPLHPMYRFSSAYTMPGEGIRRFLGEACLEQGREGGFWGRNVGRKELMYMMDRLYGRFVYSPGATTVETTAEEALALGRGVCQDYAHIFISLCRLAGIPARYVAGLMLGEGVSHAWVEAWTDGGWLGMDPTNNRLAGDGYIKLTHGRDFRDGSIDRGRFMGFSGQSQEIFVKVEEII